MKIAVVGTGISGMLAARLLHDGHELTVFEARPRVGGHTHTVEVAGGPAVDTGFIVFNTVTYHGFCRMLELLQVQSQPSDMSFSVQCECSGLETNPSTLNGLFAQRANLLRPSFYGMVRDLLRFLREARAFLDTPDATLSLGAFVARGGYGTRVVREHIIPLGGAIWSADASRLMEMPFLFFARFFSNHGFLDVSPRIPWRVIQGGSQRYVEKLIAPYRQQIRCGCPVLSLRRDATGVELTTARYGRERFDKVVLAVHSDQALPCWLTPARRSARSSARSATSPTTRCCTLRTVQAHTGSRPDGPVRLLTQLRYAGLSFNPVSFYYCFGRDGALRAVLAEITNTPWDERHCYVVQASGGRARAELPKSFHVSPFLPMQQTYRWSLHTPGQTLAVVMRNLQDGRTVFGAVLSLRRRPLDGWSCAALLVRFPLASWLVLLAIYWQALRLWLERMPFFPHPQLAEVPLR